MFLGNGLLLICIKSLDLLLAQIYIQLMGLDVRVFQGLQLDPLHLPQTPP